MFFLEVFGETIIGENEFRVMQYGTNNWNLLSFLLKCTVAIWPVCVVPCNAILDNSLHLLICIVWPTSESDRLTVTYTDVCTEKKREIIN